MRIVKKSADERLNEFDSLWWKKYEDYKKNLMQREARLVWLENAYSFELDTNEFK